LTAPHQNPPQPPHPHLKHRAPTNPTQPQPPRYGQAGTPQLTVETSYDAAARTFTVTTRQRTPATNGQAEKVPVMIPVKVGWGWGGGGGGGWDGVG